MSAMSSGVGYLTSTYAPDSDHEESRNNRERPRRIAAAEASVTGLEPRSMSRLVPRDGSGAGRPTTAAGLVGGDWRHRAMCRDEDPELFFPVGTDGPALLQIAEAKSVCRRCPVVSECLVWALETGQAGVWGGMSEDERRALRGRDAKARARTVRAGAER